MLEVQKRVFDAAVKQLTLLGCKYVVQMPDGTLVGELELAAPKKPQKPRVPRKNFTQYGWKKTIDAAKAGDVLVFDVPKGVTAGKAQSILCAYAGELWGKGTYTSAQVNGQIQLMRTA